MIQTFVYAENVTLAHLQFEKAILDAPKQTSGKAFTVTDPGTPYTFRDMYFLLETLSDFQWQEVPVVPLFLLSHLIEWYTLARFAIPGLSILPDVPRLLQQLQPAIFQISAAHQVALNDQAML